MNNFPEGIAVIYCEGAFNTPNGKTAHGLIRRSERYRVHSVIDSKYAGKDAAEILELDDHRKLPIFADLFGAVSKDKGANRPTHFVIGLAPDGGRLPADAREVVKQAIKFGLNVDSGLHDFLSEDAEIAALAEKHDVEIRDVRKPPDREALHFFSGKIQQVDALKVAVLGTDSAVGKRTTAWHLVDALHRKGFAAELVGTGQTAWMQGAKFSLVLDSLVNDFVAGEIEHAVWLAWQEEQPDFIIIEGQGSLMNPAYPGGFEILAAGRPDAVVLQHAPARKEYDGFPGHELHPLEKQIQAIELLSGRPVIAITINHENLQRAEIPDICAKIKAATGLPCADVLLNGADPIVSALLSTLEKKRK